VREKLEANGWRVGNIDATVIAEEPKLKDYIDGIQRSISHSLKVDIDQVSVKASTANGLGFVGRGEGIAACAVALLEAGSARM